MALHPPVPEQVRGSEACVAGGGYMPVGNTVQTRTRTGWGASGQASVHDWSCASLGGRRLNSPPAG